ncbi:hypothetical protein EUGRSUZ_G01729 [Eucalyptus grandis]|uniref:Uncharacterized protein n=2 Tax=Eucalyptus grandis TaxID=71139 RepID=A0ACC3K3Q7_EUCGR|nr:hypothetical protein EUGRSUZ_G01729 [Eucalyptus grandis]
MNWLIRKKPCSCVARMPTCLLQKEKEGGGQKYKLQWEKKKTRRRVKMSARDEGVRTCSAEKSRLSKRPFSTPSQ